jgi:spermidine synthase
MPIRPAVLMLFFLSGASALVYEVVWMRQLVLVFGATTYATSTVLAAYMGGLALGSHACGRLADRSSRLLALYAGLELGIGLYALLTPHLFGALALPYTLLRALGWPPLLQAAARAALAALVLVVPTALMGGTFPVLARLFVQLRSEVGRATGALYLANTAGAVLGCVLAGLWLIERFGLAGTTYLAAATNVGLAVAAACLAPLAADAPAPPVAAPTTSRRAPPRFPAGGRASPSSASVSRASRRWPTKCSGRAPCSASSTTRPTRSPRCSHPFSAASPWAAGW